MRFFSVRMALTCTKNSHDCQKLQMLINRFLTALIFFSHLQFKVYFHSYIFLLFVKHLSYNTIF